MAHVAIGDSQDNSGGVWQDKTQLYALAGNDTIISDNKNDFLIVGGSGDDSLIMYGGKGSISGGAGKDTFDLTYSADRKLSAVIEDLEPANDKIVVNFDGDAAPQLTSSVSGNDVIWRDSDGFLNVTLKGVRENDYFDGTASNETWEVLEITNNEREAKNLPWLTMSADLMQGASVRAQEITALGLSGILTDHTRPNGEDFSTVLEKEYVSPPHENLEAGAASAAEVMENWMESTTHRENILNPNFNKLGVGYNYQDDGDPIHHRYYWTQLFADNLKSPETVSTADLLTANIEVNTVKKFVTLTENPDVYSNSEYGATIAAKGGDDSISNSGLLVSISGGNDNNTIDNRGSFTTINAGGGNDLIRLDASTKEVLIQYTGGNDTVSGLNSTDTVSISGSSFTPVTLGSDIIVSVGTDSITLANAANSSVQISGTRSKLYILTEGNDSLENTIDGATITALGGNDSITNDAMKVSINGGKDDDTIRNFGDENVTIDGDDGNNYIINNGKKVTITGGKDDDTVNTSGDSVIINLGDGVNSVRNYGASVLIDLGAGNDTVWSYGVNSTIRSGSGNDDIWNDSDSITIDSGAGVDVIHSFNSNVSIYGGADNDYIYNNSLGANVTIDGGDGIDDISNEGSNVIIYGGAGDDSIYNHYLAYFVTIYGGTGHDFIGVLGDSVAIYGGVGIDSIQNGYGDSVSVAGGAGNDTIRNDGHNVTINGGADNDRIVLWSKAQNNLIQYKSGDGRDTVWGFNETDTLQIMGGTGFYSTLESDEDIFVYVGTGSIMLRNAAGLSAVNISGRRREFREETAVVTLTEDPDTYSNTVEGMTILALGGADSITNSGANVSIDGGADDDYINTAGNNVTVEVGDGDDSIFNDGDLASLNGGDGKDFIANSGANVSMDGGKGDDFISLSSDSENNLIIYNEGDGNDTISGFKNTDVLRIFNQKFTRSTVGNDVVVKVGNSPGSVTLLDGATLTPPYINIWDTLASNLITLFETNNQFSSDIDDATIVALGGDDTVENYGANVSISGGTGDDFITNRGENSTLDGNAGNDSISNYSNNVIINGGDGDDKISNYDNNATILGCVEKVKPWEIC